jgi:hypothetical protein
MFRKIKANNVSERERERDFQGNGYIVFPQFYASEKRQEKTKNLSSELA